MRVLIALVVLPLAVACSRGDKAVVVVAAEPALADSVTVEVVNDNYYDARVYAVYVGGTKHPLGTVRSYNSESDLRIPWQPRPLVFEVHLVTGFQKYASHQIDVFSGDYVQLRLPANFEVSDSFRKIPD
jgi:hypothetical protein